MIKGDPIQLGAAVVLLLIIIGSAALLVLSEAYENDLSRYALFSVMLGSMISILIPVISSKDGDLNTKKILTRIEKLCQSLESCKESKPTDIYGDPSSSKTSPQTRLPKKPEPTNIYDELLAMHMSRLKNIANASVCAAIPCTVITLIGAHASIGEVWVSVFGLTSTFLYILALVTYYMYQGVKSVKAEQSNH